MYNAELKNRFLTDSVTGIASREQMINTFNAVEAHESKLGRDVCTMSVPEVEKIISDTACGFRSHSLGLRLRNLRRYCKWCIDNKVEGATDSLLKAHIDMSDTDELRKQAIRSPLHLQMVLDKIFLPEETQTVDNLRRAYLWFAYSGLPEKDAMELTDGDIDLTNLTIKSGTEHYPIYKEAIPALRFCISSPYVMQRVVSKPGEYFPRARISDQRIFRAAEGVIDTRYMRSCIVIAVKKAGGDFAGGISYRKLSYFGLFYRAYERELAGLDPGFKALFADKGLSDRSLKDHLYQIRRDYARWKQTLI